MKKAIILLVIAAALAGLSTAKAQSTGADTASVKMTVKAIAPSVTQPTVSQAAVQLMQAYYDVKNALLADNGNLAMAKAGMLLAGVRTMPVEALTPGQQKIWKSYSNAMLDDTKEIARDASLVHQREFFARLSKSILEVMKGMRLNQAIIYEQYCPMKKAIWLSENSAIKNPYYGNRMGACGETIAKLEPASK